MSIKKKKSLAAADFTSKLKQTDSLKQKQAFSIPLDCVTPRPSEFGLCAKRINVKTESLQFMLSKLLTENRNFYITGTAAETTAD